MNSADVIDGTDFARINCSADEFVSFLQQAHEQLEQQRTSEEGMDVHHYKVVLEERVAQLQRVVTSNDSFFAVLADQLNIDNIEQTQMSAQSVRSAVFGGTQHDDTKWEHDMLVAVADKLGVGIVVVTCLETPHCVAYHPPSGISQKLWLGMDHSCHYASLVPHAPLIARAVDIELDSISDKSLQNAAARIRREMGFESFNLITKLVRQKVALPVRETGSPWSGQLGKSPTVSSALNYYRLLNALWLRKKSGSFNLTGQGEAFRLFERYVGSLTGELRPKVRFLFSYLCDVFLTQLLVPTRFAQAWHASCKRGSASRVESIQCSEIPRTR